MINATKQTCLCRRRDNDAFSHVLGIWLYSNKVSFMSVGNSHKRQTDSHPAVHYLQHQWEKKQCNVRGWREQTTTTRKRRITEHLEEKSQFPDTQDASRLIKISNHKHKHIRTHTKPISIGSLSLEANNSHGLYPSARREHGVTVAIITRLV